MKYNKEKLTLHIVKGRNKDFKILKLLPQMLALIILILFQERKHLSSILQQEEYIKSRVKEIHRLGNMISTKTLTHSLIQ
mmetsp:Transcript_13583/g.2160  ORF Transcript_13583/g.2160 Transcript_13583/m.2160 type:complete len:80 (+) Transcript_13583:1185-1424(+)